MPRNKTAKRNAKRAKVNNATSNMQKMEKEFMEVPAKLAALANKDIAALKQKENKIKNAREKARAQVKNWETRVKAASKAAATAAGKKQLNTAKKAFNESMKACAALDAEWKEISQSLDAIVRKCAKLQAISKLLNQFEKDWAKNSKQLAAKAKAKTKTKRKKATAKSASPRVDQPQVENIETTMSESVSFDEVPEMAS